MENHCAVTARILGLIQCLIREFDDFTNAGSGAWRSCSESHADRNRPFRQDLCCREAIMNSLSDHLCSGRIGLAKQDYKFFTAISGNDILYSASALEDLRHAF